MDGCVGMWVVVDLMYGCIVGCVGRWVVVAWNWIDVGRWVVVGWTCRQVVGGSVDMWMDLSVCGWWLGECVVGCVLRWVVLGCMCR